MPFTLIFELIATVGFGLALVLVFRIQKNLIGHPARIFLAVFLFAYFLVGLSNILEHGGLANILGRYEYLAELFFPPIFLFFIFPIFSLYIFSTYMKQDLELRLRAEKELRESEARYRSLFENSLDGISISRDNRVIAVNQALLDLFGFQGINDFDRISTWPPDPRRGRRPASGNRRYACRITRGDGEERDIEVSAGEIMLGEQQHTQCTFRDITEQKQVEREIRRAKEEWERTFDTVPDLIAVLDDHHRFIRVNRKLADHLGKEPDNLIGRNFHEIVHSHGEPLPDGPDNQRATVMEGMVEIYEESNNGHYQISISPLFDENGRYAGSVRVAHDITDLKRAEQELEATRSFLQSIIDGVTDSIMVIGSDYRVRLLNKAAIRVHGLDRQNGYSGFCYRISHHRNTPCDGQDHPCPLKDTIQFRQPETLIHQHRRPDGTFYTVEIAASPLFDEKGRVTGIIEVGRDISEKLRLEKEQKKFEARLFQQQKDRSIATVAKGIAHDFNNMLGTILGNVELLQMGTVAREEECGIIEQIGSAAQRMTDLTLQLLAYAKEGTYRQETLNLNELLKESLQISRRTASAETEVVQDLAEDLWPVIADPGQMSQMLVNVMTNAFEAMHEGGVLTVRSENTGRDRAWECRHQNLHPAGDYVRLTITDTGPGIPGEIQERLFEPFVSSKFLGRGLGLAAALGIAQNHGGCITISDGELGGTKVLILLPRGKASQGV